MVLIMTTTLIPQGKEKLVGEKYLEIMRKYPGEVFEKAVLPLGVISSQEGTKVYSIVKINEGQYENAIHRITKRLIQISQIEGVKYKIETLLSGDEALSLIGLSIPASLPM